MRLFQNGGVAKSYRLRLAELTADCSTFVQARDAFLYDGFGSMHSLKPVIEGAASAFFTNGDDEHLQRLWAVEQGMSSHSALEDIILAQIEHHRTEVFYNQDPMRYGDDFLSRLPGSVRRTIAWRAAPSAGGKFFDHDLIVNNFPSILETFRKAGARVAPFFPAHNPALDAYATTKDRPIDVLFVGTYSRHHVQRARMLEAVAALRTEMNVVFHLDRSKFTALAETPLGWFGPLRKHRRSANIRSTARGPVFGRDLAAVLGQAKVVVNGAIDMAGVERGNMRIWEALGCGAALVSDEGQYPELMKPGQHFATYADPGTAVALIRSLVRDDKARTEMAERGNAMIRTDFSKDRQWQAFEKLAA